MSDPKIQVQLTPTNGGAAKTVQIDAAKTIQSSDGNSVSSFNEVFGADSEGKYEYTEQEQAEYGAAIQSAIQEAYGEEQIDWSAYEASYTYSTNQETTDDDVAVKTAGTTSQDNIEAQFDQEVEEVSSVAQEEEIAAAQEALDGQQVTQEEAQDQLEQATSHFENKYPGYPDNMSEEDAAACKEEQNKILHALFDPPNSQLTPEEIDAMSPTSDFWDIAQIDPETGKVSLGIYPHDSGKPTSKLDCPWEFVNSLFPGQRGFQNEDFYARLTTNSQGERQEFKWHGGDTPGIQYGGNTNNVGKTALGAAPEAGDETKPDSPQDPAAPQDPNAPQDPATEEPPAAQQDPELPAAPPKEEDINVSEPDADGKIKVGNGTNDEEVDFKDPNIKADDQGNYSGETEDGRFAVVSSENGVTTVTYYDMNDIENGAPKEGAQATSSTTHNRDGSTVNTTKDGDNTIETRTSADGQSTSVTTDKDGNPTEVSVNGDKYKNDGEGNWYQVDDNGQVVNGPDGFPIKLTEPPTIENGNITIKTGDKDNPCIKTFAPDGSLSKMTIDGIEYDLSGCKATKDGDNWIYEKIGSADGNSREKITIDADGNVTVEHSENGENGPWNGQKYDSEGNLISIKVDSNGAWLDVNQMTDNGDGTYTDANGVTYTKGADGRFSSDAGAKLSWDNGLNVLTLPDGTQVTLAGNDAKTDPENGNFSGMTQVDTDGDGIPDKDCYVEITTDPETGAVTTNYYDEKPEEGSEAQPTKTSIYNKDGSSQTTETVDDGNGNKTTTTTTVDAKGNKSSVEVKETKDPNTGEVTTTTTRTNGNSSTTVVSDSQGNPTEITVDGKTYTPATGGTWLCKDTDEFAEFEIGPNGEIKQSPVDAKGNQIGEIKTYGPDGKLASIEVGGQTYDLSEYKDNVDGTYTKYCSSDGSVTQTISHDADGNMVVTTNDANGESSSITYGEDGTIQKLTIGTEEYEVKVVNGQYVAIVDGKEVPFGFDQWGRYTLLEE